MQNKFELISDDTKREITKFLSNNELLKLSMASKTEWNFFKPLLEERQLSILWTHVVRGESDKLVSILKANVHLLCETGPVIDCSGRCFESISPIQYAFWALDKHMWTAMLDCVLKSEKANEVLEIILSQYNEVHSKGVTYRLNKEIITEKHFDFENTIIKELQMQVDSQNALGMKDWDAIDKQWREGVGGAQKRLPMHVIYEYCSIQLFHPQPKFTSKPESSMQFNNKITRQDENWFCPGSQLGVDFAILKSAGTVCKDAWLWGCCVDLAALKALCEIRTEDFISLKPLLEQQKTVDHLQFKV